MVKSALVSFFVVLANLQCYVAQNDTQIQARFVTPCVTPNNEMAICTEIQRCRLLLQAMSKPESLEFISRSRCGPKNEDLDQFRVCCGSRVNYIHATTARPAAPQMLPPTQPAKKCDRKPPEEAHVTLKNILPSKCGRQSVAMRNRIFGGVTANVGEFPWMVRLRHRSVYGNLNFGCSGFLIHKKYVLTAAHCVVSRALSPLGPITYAVLGDHDIETDIDCSEDGSFCADSVVVVKTDTPIVHPGYIISSRNHHHDIAIIPLKTRVNITDFVQPICLLDKCSSDTELWLSGWGKTESDESSKIKLKVFLPRVSNAECKDIYSRMNINITENQMCAGGEYGKDACTGDSGGALMVHGKKGVWYAEGIVSYGVGCARPGWPGVYTYLPNYVAWIKNAINSREEMLMKNRLRKG